MQLSIFQVDAFTDRVFGGNPAAVCPLDHWLPDDTMLKIAIENSKLTHETIQNIAGAQQPAVEPAQPQGEPNGNI